jgi:ABC-2 type transport system ATP-binding protein/lipopolysaccharide transport system ATP-binding protein
MPISIKLNNVNLNYIVKSGSNSFKKTIIASCSALLKRNVAQFKAVQHTSYQALKNINLQINPEDRIGILGKNGAGKSTLLRVMAKVYKPNTGTVYVNGKIASLFDVCLGMDSEATGYENIINLAIMRGLSKKAATNIIYDVENFTELGAFLNAPVRTYSSGMAMKLAFGVATAVAPEIILIDEIIGVGDVHFMQKAKTRILDMLDKTQIVVLTSHSTDIIRQFCNKTIVLAKGEIMFTGNVEDGIEYYSKN